ncbi:MAG: T9SS type A sorting domain-containing protein [Bacteroidia bacterium]|nr:T9SS type A sorting domain-containing protein [Bacteroidia bacterium]
MKKYVLFLAFLLNVILVRAQILPVYKWAGKAAGTGSDYGDFIATDPAGNTYITGRFDGNCDFDPGAGTLNLLSAGSTDIYFAKYSPTGSLVWAKRIGSTSGDRAYAMDVDAAGNIYLIGYFSVTVDFDPGPANVSLTSMGGFDTFFAKYTSDGNLVWVRTLGEANTEYGEIIKLDGSGNLYIGGEFSSPTLDLDAGAGTATVTNGSGGTAASYDPYLAKYDTAGNYLWGYNFPGTSSDYLKSMAVDANGRVIVAGYFSTTMNVDIPGGVFLNSNGSSDCYIVRFTAAGILDYSVSFGGLNSDILYSIDTYNNNVYATGTFNAQVDFDPGVDTFNLQSAGLTDVFISCLNDAGEFSWAGAISSPGSENSNFIKLNGNGDVYVAGSFIDSADFDPGAGVASLYAVTDRDAFVAKYSNSGSYVWGLRIGSNGTEYARSIAIDPNNGDVLTSGYFTAGTLYVDPLNLANFLTNTGLNDIFFGRYGECAFPVVSAQPVNSGVCPGGSTSFSVSSNGSNLTYQWQEGTNGGINWNNVVDGGNYSGATTPTLSLSGLGTPFNNRFYRCVSSADCGLSTTSGVGILFVGQVDTTVNVNQHILTSAATNASYQWLDCNNGYAPIPGASQQQFIPAVPGTYALSVTKNGCNDTSACYTITTIGLNDITTGDIRIFPVPAQNEITIETAVPADYEAGIYDLSGRRLLNDKIRFTVKTTVGIQHLESGAYLLGLRKNQGEESFFRIVKR